VTQTRSAWLESLHLGALVALALAQPLYDLLARHAGFLVAHRATPADIVLLVALLSVVAPAVVIVLAAVGRLPGERIGWGVHVSLVALLVACILMPFIKRREIVDTLSGALSWSGAGDVHGAVLVAASAVIGIGVAILYAHFRPVRMFMTALTPAWILIPAFFLASASVSKLLFQRIDTAALDRRLDCRAPIIMVVFDAFPLVSLLDEHRQIDPIRYPNLAALARDAYWFRNATSVHQLTGHALPAILTGKYPQTGELPTAADHPFNLFTLLGGTYELKVFEDMTQLCPAALARGAGHEAGVSWLARFRVMVVDLTIVYLHVLLPDDLVASLPQVTETWKDFLGPTRGQLASQGGRAMLGRVTRFNEFVASIRPSDQPRLYFLHVLLPHGPYVHLPSGKLYSPPNLLHIPGLKGEMWGAHEWLVAQAYQRHLLQVALVDRLIGELVARLKLLGLYDEALVVITADHGEGFWPNEARRDPARTRHPGDILRVPLLIKAPFQAKHDLSDRNVETIDILPTMADILDITLPWKTDGQSALGRAGAEKQRKTIFNQRGKRMVFDASPEANFDSLTRKIELFGTGAKANGLYRYGPYELLIGRKVDEQRVRFAPDGQVRLDPQIVHWTAARSAAFVPAFLIGTWQTPSDIKDTVTLAVAINGTIWSVGPGFHQAKDTWGFAAVVPESAFQAGENEIELYRVTGTEADPSLVALSTTPLVIKVAAQPHQREAAVRQVQAAGQR